MQGEYNLWVVGLSYLVAVVASFTALEIAGKVMQPQSRTSVWVLAGSLAMGTGIWSMHFVGMEAFKLPIDVIYDIPLTLLSWVAAVGVSALALWTLSRLKNRSNVLDPKIIIPAGLLMGAGICIMHYSGMFAMRLSPAIDYDLVLLTASFLIAGSAAIVTLLIAVTLREVTRLWHLMMRFGAALIMGVAITGMHYTGMAAARFSAGAVCTTPSGLETGWTAGPITLVTLAVLAVALYASIRDTRIIRQRIEQERLEKEAAERRAFEDPDTGLYNRSWLTLSLSNRSPELDKQLSLITLESDQALSGTNIRSFGDWLRTTFPRVQASSVQPGLYALVSENDNSEDLKQQVVAELRKSRFAAASSWRVGASSFPADVPTPFRLLPTARSRAVAA